MCGFSRQCCPCFEPIVIHADQAFCEGCDVPRSAPEFRFSTVPTPGERVTAQGSVLWLLQRRSALTVVQLGWCYLSLCAVVLTGMFLAGWQQSSPQLTKCVWLALLVVGVALVRYARHASDAEKILLQGGQLVIELESAGRTERAEFHRDWVRVEPRHGDGSLIEVSGQGYSVRVGRHMRPELRPMLAREIRRALRVC